MLGCLAAAAIIVGLSLVTGRAVLVLCGLGDPRWPAGVVGLVVLLALATVAVSLPGHASTAIAAVTVVATGAAVVVHRRGRPWRVDRAAVGAGLATAGLGLLPYAFNGRFGPLGPGLNDDLGFHFAWAEALDTAAGADALVSSQNPGYPLGPHALVAAVGEVAGGVPEAFAGLLLAVPVLTALAALGVLRGAGPTAARAVAATLAALTYLGASYYAQAQFKELLLALFVVALVSALEATKEEGGWRAGVPLGLLAVGALLSYSLYGPALLAAITGVWLVAERRRASLVKPLAAATGIAAVAFATQADRLADLQDGLGAGTGGDIYPGGNFIGQIPVRLVLGTWFSRDFRFPSEHTIATDAGVLLAVALALFGVVMLVRRRDLALVVAAAVTLAVYAQRRGADVPYYSAKLLVVAAPLVVLVIARGALATERRVVHATAALLALIMLGSSLHALRGAPVGDPDRTRELVVLRDRLGEGDVLFLPIDHFVRSSLPDVSLTARELYGFVNEQPLGVKPRAGEPLEAKDVPALERFDHIVTTRSALPPPGHRVVAQTPSFRAWAPGGRTTEPDVLVVDAEGWRRPDGSRPERDGLGHAYADPGDTLTQTIDLPPGRHDVSLQYKTPVDVHVEAGELRTTLPRSLDPPADRWPVGTVDGGRITVTVRLDDAVPGRLPPRGSIGDLAFTAR